MPVSGSVRSNAGKGSVSRLDRRSTASAAGSWRRSRAAQNWCAGNLAVWGVLGWPCSSPSIMDELAGRESRCRSFLRHRHSDQRRGRANQAGVGGRTHRVQSAILWRAWIRSGH